MEREEARQAREHGPARKEGGKEKKGERRVVRGEIRRSTRGKDKPHNIQERPRHKEPLEHITKR